MEPRRVDSDMSTSIQAWKLYWVEGRTLKGVAEGIGLAPNTLRRHWDYWGFPKRRPGPRPRNSGTLSEKDVKRILKLVQKKPQAEVAREFGVSRQYVNQLVKARL